MAQFEIVEMTTAGPLSANLGVFPDGKIAASLIPGLLIQHPGRKFQPRPIKDDTTDWKARERERMADREPLPWDLTPIANHFAHRDPANRKNVIFTPDETFGKLDRRSVVHVNNYLYRFYSMSDDERRTLVWDYLGFDPGVKFTQDTDLIEAIYTNGPNSCMAYSASNYATEGTHPSWCYGGPDLSLAYFQDESDEYTARCVVWQDRKIYGRVYGDALALTQALDALGYRKSTDQADWLGARMRSKWISEGWDEEDGEYREGYLMPYLDFANNVHIEEDNNGDVIATVDDWGIYQARNTHGLAIEDYHFCPSCSKNVPAGKIGYLNDSHAAMCHRCLTDRSYAQDIVYGRWHKTDSGELTALAGGDYILTAYAKSDLQTFVCPVTNERWAFRRAVSIRGRYYSPEGARQLEEQKEAA